MKYEVIDPGLTPEELNAFEMSQIQASGCIGACSNNCVANTGACPADACGVYAGCNTNAGCGANGCGADMCGVNACGANACGANACEVEACPADMCLADVCGADFAVHDRFKYRKINV